MKRQHVAVALWISTCALSCQALSLTEVDDARAAGTLKEVVIFGSSVLSPALGAYIKSEVCAGAADYDEYWNDASGQLFRAYSCTMPAPRGFPAHSKLLVVKRDKDGSVYGVNQVTRSTPGQSMVVSASGCSTFSHGSTPAATCGTTTPTIPVAGISDVEPALFAKSFRIGFGTPEWANQPDRNTDDDAGRPWTPPTTAQINGLGMAPFGQTIFGVAVTKILRDKLQSAQGLVVGSDAEADTPTLTAGFISGALSGFVRGGRIGYASWSAATGDLADSSKQVVICQGVAGSGVRAASNAFFLGMADMADTALGMLAPQSSGQAANVDGSPVPGITVHEGAVVSDIERCLHSTHAGDYAIGVLPKTHDPVTRGTSHRFVRLGSTLPLQPLARDGRYEFVYASTLQWRNTTNPPDTPTKNFLINIRFNALNSTHIASYSAQQGRLGLLATPHHWMVETDACRRATNPDDALYGSCVEHIDFFNDLQNPATHIFGLDRPYASQSSGPLHLVK